MLAGFLGDRMMKAAHKGGLASASVRRHALATGVVVSSRSPLALLLLRVSNVFADDGAAAFNSDSQTTVVAVASVVAVVAAAVAWLWWPPAPDQAQTPPPPWWPWSRPRLASRVNSGARAFQYHADEALELSICLQCQTPSCTKNRWEGHPFCTKTCAALSKSGLVSGEYCNAARDAGSHRFGRIRSVAKRVPTPGKPQTTIAD